MKFLLKSMVLATICCLASMGCTGSSTCPEREPPLKQASEEARLMAMCLEDELHPPPALAAAVDSNLVLIRSQFAVEYPIVEELVFRPPWVPSRIIIGFVEATAEMVRDDKYDAWDDLNEEYGVTEIDKALVSLGAVKVNFESLMHPDHLIEIYSGLPGVSYVERDNHPGDWENIYPRRTDEGVTYLFRDAWEGCPVGCIYQELWYFTVADAEVEFVGHWKPARGTPEPAWWEDAAQNVDLFRKWQYPP
jgi:hypothetical protein